MEYVLGEYINAKTRLLIIFRSIFHRNDVKTRLINIFKKYNVTNYEIDYYYKVFGNIVCKFEFNGKKYEFVTDRGEIILNNETIDMTCCFNDKLMVIDVLESIIIKILEQ